MLPNHLVLVIRISPRRKIDGTKSNDLISIDPLTNANFHEMVK